MVAAHGTGTTHKEARESSSLVIARAAKQSRVAPGSNFYTASLRSH